MTGTAVLLIRHAHTDAIGRYLAGRAPGLALSAAGQVQAERLGRALANASLSAIYTSPLERTVSTARAIARHHAAPVMEVTDLLEIDFGAWTGMPFSELDAREDWQQYNRARGSAAIPGGERSIDVQQRAVAAVEHLAAQHTGRTIGVVSHGDVLRYVVLHYAGSTLDLFGRFEIAPASVTALVLGLGEPRLQYVNNTTYASTP